MRTLKSQTRLIDRYQASFKSTAGPGVGLTPWAGSISKPCRSYTKLPTTKWDIHIMCRCIFYPLSPSLYIYIQTPLYVYTVHQHLFFEVLLTQQGITSGELVVRCARGSMSPGESLKAAKWPWTPWERWIWYPASVGAKFVALYIHIYIQIDR